MNRKVFLIALLTAGCLYAHAQETKTEPFTISIYANAGIPSKQFKEALNNQFGGASVGVGSSVLFNVKGKKELSPLALGIDFSYLTFGRDKTASTSGAPPYKTTFNFYSVSAISRVILSKRATGFTPFIDGMLGVKIVNTRTKIDKNALNILLNNDQPEVINNTNDYGLGYGLGMGWYTRKKAGDNGQGTASFTLRVMYLWGDQTSYVKRGSLQVNNGYVSYETGYTNTNMVLIQLGIFIASPSKF